jgi:hypothetical protein
MGRKLFCQSTCLNLFFSICLYGIPIPRGSAHFRLRDSNAPAKASAYSEFPISVHESSICCKKACTCLVENSRKAEDQRQQQNDEVPSLLCRLRDDRGLQKYYSVADCMANARAKMHDFRDQNQPTNKIICDGVQRLRGGRNSERIERWKEEQAWDQMYRQKAKGTTYLRYYRDENGRRVYTVQKIDPNGLPTLPAHPPSFNPSE